MTESQVGLPVKGLLVAYGSALGSVLGLIYFLMEILGLQVVSAGSVVSVQDLKTDFVAKETVEDLYTEREIVARNYTPNERVKERLGRCIPRNDVEREYVPKERYQELADKHQSVIEEREEIPKPFPSIKQTLSPTGVWKNEKLGIYVKMIRLLGANDMTEVEFILALPNSPKHREIVTTGAQPRIWKFKVNRRSFTLELVNLDPTVFEVREVAP